jgi:hypothetical protein
MVCAILKEASDPFLKTAVQRKLRAEDLIFPEDREEQALGFRSPDKYGEPSLSLGRILGWCEIAKARLQARNVHWPDLIK